MLVEEDEPLVVGFSGRALSEETNTFSLNVSLQCVVRMKGVSRNVAVERHWLGIRRENDAAALDYDQLQ